MPCIRIRKTFSSQLPASFYLRRPSGRSDSQFACSHAKLAASSHQLVHTSLAEQLLEQLTAHIRTSLLRRTVALWELPVNLIYCASGEEFQNDIGNVEKSLPGVLGVEFGDPLTEQAVIYFVELYRTKSRASLNDLLCFGGRITLC